METQLYLLNIGHLLQQDHEDLLRKVNYITGNCQQYTPIRSVTVPIGLITN